MKLSVVIPSRNERFLEPTVRDVLAKARGDVEVIVVLDGYWPQPPLPEDKRLILLHRGAALGMRPGINAAVACSRGDVLMKLDAHCALPEGYDVELTRELADDWVVVPRRYALDPEAWAIQDTGKIPIDYHYLSYPFAPGVDGLHGSPWRERSKGREHLEVDDEMSSQGSCWVMTRRHWDRMGPLDVEAYGNFIQEMQEIGLKTWLGGGRMVTNKRTWYAHLHKGPKWGRGYSLRGARHEEGRAYCTRYWMLDQWAERKRDLRWLIDRFAPVPTWPADLDEAFARAREVLRDAA